MARIQLPTTRYLETLPSPEPSPEDLVFEHLDVDQLASQTALDRDCRYAQKLARRRKPVFRWAMERIPDHEREAVRLSLEGKSQREIATIQRISQNTVFHRLKLAQNRLQWLCNVGSKVTAKKLQLATNALLRREDQRILLAWWETGSQSEAARRVFGTGHERFRKRSDGRSGYWNCKLQDQCRESLIRSRNVIKNSRGLWRISEALESLWSNAEIRMVRPAKKPASESVVILSQPPRIEANCHPVGNSTALAACVSANEKA